MRTVSRVVVLGRGTVSGVPSMVRMGARVSLAEDRPPEAYGSTLISVHDAAGRQVRREVRGRELEVLDIVQFVDLDDSECVATSPGETRLIAPLSWSVEQLRDEARRIVYDDGDRRPRWHDLLEALEATGISATDASLAALPFVIELDNEVAAQYGV